MNSVQARCALGQAVEFVSSERDRLAASVASSPKSFEALSEQRYALQFLEQLSVLAGGQLVDQFKLLDLLRPALASVSEMLLQTPDALQRSVPPKSQEERALASRLPSGAPLARLGSSSTTRVLTSAYWSRLVAVMQASLCTALSALGGPAARNGLAFAAIGGEPALLTALRATLFCLRAPHDDVQRNIGARPASVLAVRSSLIDAAKTCISIHSAVALQAAANQLAGLEKAMALAAAHDRVNSGALKAADVQRRLHNFADDLERLPGAIGSWAESAMDDIGVEDSADRKAVLAPLAEVRETASRGIAAAKLAASSV